MTGPHVWSPDPKRYLAQEIGEGLQHNDPDAIVRFWFDGFGIKPSDAQIEARIALGRPGPRVSGEKKYTWVSGGQRAGKTIELFMWHAEACLYKVGVDTTDRQFYDNFAYKTLHGAPTDELSLKMWAPAVEIRKGASDTQYDKINHRARKGAFLNLFDVSTSGIHGIIRFRNGSFVDFRSTEGKAKRLEGTAWWFITWDEWASQHDTEIHYVLVNVLTGRARDFDGKIVAAAWPKPETERHLMDVIRRVETGKDPDSQIVYLPADEAHFTNEEALATEKRTKTQAEWDRTVLGIPAGGASIEFPKVIVDNMIDEQLPFPATPDMFGDRLSDYHFLITWDLGLAHDEAVGISWAIPKVGVTVHSKALVVNAQAVRVDETSTLDTLEYAIAREQGFWRGQSAVDATGIGGVHVSRSLMNLKPPPFNFVARSNDRFHGNMRIASISAAIDVLTWDRPKEGVPSAGPWGLIRMPRIIRLIDQMASFDRNAKNVPDDWVSALLIGTWYIRRLYVVADGSRTPVPFALLAPPPPAEQKEPRRMIDMRGQGW